MVTNEFERDLNDQAGLKRAGRVDLVVFQNTADAGDGNPGVQRCFRNYLHEGGMEKDLDLVGYGIKGTSVDLTNAKLQEFNNIGSVTISAAQWIYVGGADQPVKMADSPTFVGLTINGNIVITGNVDGVDVLDLKTAFDILETDHNNKINQDVRNTASPTFSGLTLSADLVTTSTVDGVNVSDLKTAFDNHKTSTGVDHSYIDQSVIITASPTFNGLTLNGNIVSNDGLIIQTSEGNLDLKAVTNFWGIDIYTSNTLRWYFKHDGNFEPATANTYDIGDPSHEVKTLYYCNMSDTTCAYLGDYSYEDLYNLYAQIKPMEDGGLHYSEPSKQYFPHIDFKTLPKEFSTPAPEDMIKENVWELNDEGEIVKRKVEYKVGDTIAIDAGVYLYGLGNLVVKMGKKIEKLEKEIELLKNN